jgi:hypothetical protein
VDSHRAEADSPLAEPSAARSARGSVCGAPQSDASGSKRSASRHRLAKRRRSFGDLVLAAVSWPSLARTSTSLVAAPSSFTRRSQSPDGEPTPRSCRMRRRFGSACTAATGLGSRPDLRPTRAPRGSRRCGTSPRQAPRARRSRADARCRCPGSCRPAASSSPAALSRPRR